MPDHSATPDDIIRLSKYAIRIAGLGRLQAADKEDLESGLMVRAVEILRKYNPEKSKFSTYFLRFAAVHAWRQHKRDSRWRNLAGRQVSVFTDVCAEEFFLTDPATKNVRKANWTQEAVESMGYLTDREREVIVENVLKGTRLNELSKSLGISAERVRQIREWALHKMRKRLLN